MSVAPDEGMVLLQERMAAAQATRAGRAPRDDGGGGPGRYELDGDAAPGGAQGGGLEVLISATLAAGRSIERMAARFGQAVPWEVAHPIEIPGQQNNAAGVITDPDRLGPRDGWAWRVFGVGVQLGAGTTAWNVYYDSVNDPTNWIFGGSVSGRWEPSHFYLMPNRLLVYQSVGGGITVGKGCAVEIAVPFLPDYMSK